MNGKIGLSVSAMLCATLFLGCGAGNTTGLIVDASLYKGKQRCIKIDQDLIKVDQYIERVSHTDAFHLEEAAEALQNPDISVSNNKPQMLKDANAIKKSLEAERQKSGCQNVK